MLAFQWRLKCNKAKEDEEGSWYCPISDRGHNIYELDTISKKNDDDTLLFWITVSYKTSRINYFLNSFC